MTEGLTQLTQPLWVAELLRSAALALWQGALLAVVLALVLRLVPDSRSRFRYRAALTALVCLPLLFVLNTVIPNFPTFVPAPTLEVGAVTGGGAGGVAEGLQRSSQAALEQLPLFLSPAVHFATSWVGLVAAYLLAVAALSSRLAAQLLYLKRLRRTALPGDAALQARVRALVARSGSRAGLRAAPQLAFSERVDTAMVMGWRAPLILLPTAIREQLTPAQLDGVLLHELAHVRAHDYAVNFWQLLVETVFCFHPAVWWLSGVVRQERERRCDDLAARCCGDRRDYAEALLALERARAQPTTAPALAGTSGDFSARIGRLFGLRAPRGSLKGLVTLTLALSLALGVQSQGVGLAQPRPPVAPAPNPGGALRPEELVISEWEAGEPRAKNDERAANTALPGEPTPAKCADLGGRWFHMGMAGLIMEPEAYGDGYGDDDGAEPEPAASATPSEDFFIETPEVVYRGRCALAPSGE